MKKFIHTSLILFCLLLQSHLFANTVIVKGYIRDANNKAVANKTVKIYTDSSNQTCLLSHTTITNPNGYYIDTLICNDDIRKLKIMVENCNGTVLINDPQVTTTNIVESNFTICVTQPPTPTNCHAAFSYISFATGVKFNGAGSEAPGGDSIISRTWLFGDSSVALTGNRIDPTHTYTKPGIYNVCLYIKTKKGCESKYCSTVIFTPVSNDCNIRVQLSTEKISSKKIRFNSGLSETLLSDSIVQRIWKFGDGSSLDGNQINPLKEYKDTGVYNVCIQVRTAKGCEKTFCLSVIVRDSVPGILPLPANCKAAFSFSIKDSTITFNSENSRAASEDDSIISRTWYYADNSTSVSLTGNVSKPSHTYSKPGSYNVYLVIKTKKGCESKYAGIVVIAPRPEPVNCKANFIFITQGSTVKFNGSTSVPPAGDSIISRVWSFGDSSTPLTGNHIDPSHQYAKEGNYTACLSIKTKRGCESKYCVSFSLRDSVPWITPANCKAVFTFTIKDSTISFNSEGSHAASAEDSIISRTWYYADNSTSVSLTGNVSKPSHTYSKPGSYNVYLVIKTKKGCESKYTGIIVIAPRPVPSNCKAAFSFSIKDSTITFNSESSRAASEDDSIISRTWYYADNSTSVSLTGNVSKPSHTYSKPGSYKVYLVIKTKKGCESKFAETVVITPRPVPANCKALFTFRIQNLIVNYNSTASNATSAEDSIISRIWLFGDSTVPVQGNSKEPSHTYKKGGTYTVYLSIKTKKGCESKYAATVVIVPVNCTVQVNFTAERISSKKVQFNSSLSSAQGDSIIQRNWKFGNNTILSGNQISPVKEFPIQGVYTTCLRIKTIDGCEAELCKQVVVQDSVNLPQTSVDYVKIISINPNPVVTRMMVTIWSRNNNVEAELSIFDIYGTGKSNIKKVLVQGNNVIEIPTESLYHGPYFFKVSTKNGRDTRAFYKL